ncbi:GTP pyrophosphokinase [Aquimarina mytili]|uniref:(P)ppGpp synthetase n=1 Tax=Aquimarina mytili TaxID=874423 RepID=A0A937DCI1_9FLAO|nr:(p)ppGpp synthetase [Aquimarina mytili]MBL0685648.1 (p)ppGpp synthetase [Aquimarina mytili]
MKENSDKIIREFEENKFLYQELSEKSYILLNSLINDHIKPHQIQFRVKDKNSLGKKLIRKNFKYSSIKEITDIIGFRIVTYFEDDIEFIEKIITSEFEIDIKNSIDKRNLEVDKFGYRSVHFIASLSKERLKLTEYKKYKNLKFEIQIRSILQHSWAEIEHDIGYKGENEIPKSAKRTFYRVAALLEQADMEFTKLRKEIQEHEKNIRTELSNKNLDLIIDKSSLIEFVKSNKVLRELESKVETEVKNVVCGKSTDMELIGSYQLIKDLRDLNINTIRELEAALIKNEKRIIKTQETFVKDLYNDQEINYQGDEITFIKGAPILWMRNFLKTDANLNRPDL